MSLKETALLIFLSVAAGTDLCDGRIYNKWLAAGAMSAGALCLWKDPARFWDCMLGGLLPLGALMLFFSIGAIGGGDVKLLSMTGCFLGIRDIFSCMLLSFALGGAVSFIKMLWQRSLGRRICCFAGYVKGLVLSGRLTAYDSAARLPKEAVIHFSLPVLFSVWMYMEGMI